MILGIDEVGRGPWAGPLVVGAVVLGGAAIDGLDDSKKLTKKRREALAQLIQKQAAAHALGWVSAAELDEVGMSEALRLATRRAVEAVQKQCREKDITLTEIVIDGKVNFLAGTALEQYVTMLPKADALVPSVSAASIIAKVARDQYMATQDELYPEYGFAAHAGYGTAQHRAAIAAHGVTPLHRLSFKPLQHYRNDSPCPADEVHTTQQSDTTTTRGHAGESAAADALRQRGHQIVARNWRTKYCEIDIISKRGDTLYFAEVKHRTDDYAGDGLAAITRKKRNQMHYAARFYAHQENITNTNLQLIAIATSGSPPRVVRIEVVE